jgi:hypothetical protein
MCRCRPFCSRWPADLVRDPCAIRARLVLWPCPAATAPIQVGLPRHLRPHAQAALAEAGPLRKEVRKSLRNEGYSRLEKEASGVPQILSNFQQC